MPKCQRLLICVMSSERARGHLIMRFKNWSNGMFFTVCARSGFSFRLRYGPTSLWSLIPWCLRSASFSVLGFAGSASGRAGGSQGREFQFSFCVTTQPESAGSTHSCRVGSCYRKSSGGWNHCGQCEPRAMTWLEAQDVPLVAFAAPAHYLIVHDVNALIRVGVQALQKRGCRRVAMRVPVQP